MEGPPLPAHEVDTNAAEKFVAMTALHARRKFGVVRAPFYTRRQLGRWGLLPSGDTDLWSNAFDQTFEHPDSNHLPGLGNRLDNQLTVKLCAVS